MRVTLLRHATLVVEVGGLTLLVDPMLSDAEAMDPVMDSPVTRRIPMVPLPLGPAELARLVSGLDAVLLTHSHRDHWDARAREILPRTLPVICQPANREELRAGGFHAAMAVDDVGAWRGVRFARTGGRHGTGEIGERMGQVSGFVVEVPGEPSLYVAGDTIWCPEVEAALAAHRPAVVVVNAGAARFNAGGPITMSAEDVAEVCRHAPGAAVVAVHMEAVNHCLLTREALRRHLAAAGLEGRVAIPADGGVGFAD